MTERIARVVARAPISARQWNRQAQAVDDLNDAVGLVPDELDAFRADAQLMIITDVTGTALLAAAGTVAPVGAETIFAVRLAPELVEASRGAVTITVIDVNNATATDGTTNETWSMVKPFAVGDVIEAFRWESDGVFVDRNIAGRMWAADPVIGGGGGAST